MKNIIFNDNPEEVLQAEVKKISLHVVQISGVEQNLSGFVLVTDTGGAYGKYEAYTTLYRTVEGGYQLSDDGSVYTEPEPMPEPEPAPELSLEEVQEAKVTEMNTAQQATIQLGVEVTLTDGSREHFDLTDHDQISLMGLQSMVLSGQDPIPWHTSDNNTHCKFYSNADMALITTQALNYVAYHITYFRDLRIYIKSITKIAEVESITYGSVIPEKYQSEPLKAMLAAMD
ncbi:MAG: hypothetical protein PHQ72_08485 [Hespellia sp.]|nr:hypothetical protein [Hespellia sp.]